MHQIVGSDNRDHVTATSSLGAAAASVGGVDA